MAVLLRNRSITISPGMRVAAFAAGMFMFIGIRFVDWNESFVYFVVDFGCVFVFLAFFGLERPYLPAQLLYLGKVSYGLYVFHAATYVLITPKLVQRLHLRSELVSLVLTYVLTFAITAAVAAASYRYFETPFLSLKRRFEFVKSRPV